VSLAAAADLYAAAKAAEGASPRTVDWYRMITARAVGRFGADRPVDRIGAPELRAFRVCSVSAWPRTDHGWRVGSPFGLPVNGLGPCNSDVYCALPTGLQFQ
jgi:hypothetical protein